MPQDIRDDLLTYLVDKVEDLIRNAGVAKGQVALDLLAEAQELLALHANIVRRRRLVPGSADTDAQLDLPFEQKQAA